VLLSENLLLVREMIRVEINHVEIRHVEIQDLEIHVEILLV
jgi:hypothetical protein